MKCKYCFIRKSDGLNIGDVIYVVWAGSYMREVAKLETVKAYCRDVGLYFEKWSCLVDSQLEIAKAKYSTDGNPITSPFITVSITIDKLYALIIDDSFEAFESKLNLTQFEKWQRYRNTIQYHQANQHRNVIRNACQSRRKNLSVRCRREAETASMCAAAILILIVLDGIISNLMNW